FAHDEPVAPGVERPRRVTGIVVVTRRQGTDDVERAERERAQRDLEATGYSGVDPTLPQVAERLAQRDRARGARVGGREDRSAYAQRDAEVGGRRAAEHGAREVRGGASDSPLEVALVLLLGVGDAAKGRSEIDPDPFRLRRTGDAWRQSRRVEREPSRDETELAEPVELAGGLRGHPGKRIEIGH